jgi:hypothetical protein
MVELVLARHRLRLRFRKLHKLGIDHNGAEPIVLPIQRDHAGGCDGIELGARVCHVGIHGRLLNRSLRRATRKQ